MVESIGVELKHIFFRIGDFNIEDLSLTVYEGEHFVLTGPNGAGKTIVVKLIAGLLKPESGIIQICGKSVANIPPWERRIGYVPQDGVLFPNRTVSENIRFGLEVRRMDKQTICNEVERISRMLGIDHIMDRMPEGLSGGEAQRVSLARALVLKPSLLLLDEPVSAIDEETRDSLCQELCRIQKETGITTLHVSHNQKETDLVADRIGLLVDGALQNIKESAGRH